MSPNHKMITSVLIFTKNYIKKKDLRVKKDTTVLCNDFVQCPFDKFLLFGDDKDENNFYF